MPSQLIREISKIKELYQQGLSTHFIGRLFKVDAKTINSLLKKEGVTLRNRHEGKIKIPDKRFPEVLQLYQSGLSALAVAKKFHVSEPTILKILRKTNVLKKHPRRKYSVNDSAFDTLTEDSLYWLGFLMADGCVKKINVTLTISKKDKLHLEAFKKFLKAENPIHEIVIKKGKKKYKAVSLKIYSKEIIEKLISYGISPRKTLTAKALRGIDKYSSFWTGVIDGDGCLFWDKKNIPALSLCGSKLLIQQFIFFCSNYFPNFTVTPQKNKKLWVVTYYGQRAVFLMKKFYNKPFCLIRKKKRAKLYPQIYQKEFHHKPLIKEI